MGSYWLATTEYLESMSGSAPMQRALLTATGSDTVRTRIYRGRPARLLPTRWTEAWARDGAPADPGGG